MKQTDADCIEQRTEIPRIDKEKHDQGNEEGISRTSIAGYSEREVSSIVIQAWV